MKCTIGRLNSMSFLSNGTYSTISFRVSTVFSIFLGESILSRRKRQKSVGGICWGARIAQCRKACGLSQSGLARRLNISPSSVGTYEQGRREPPCDILVALSRELDVTVGYLLTGAVSCPLLLCNYMKSSSHSSLSNSSNRFSSSKTIYCSSSLMHK